MATVDRTPTSQRWPATAWWVPLLRDLLLLEAANTRACFLVSHIDLAERPPRASALEYALTERALALHPEQLEPLEPHHGLTTHLGPAHSATGWETPGHEPHG